MNTVNQDFGTEIGRWTKTNWLWLVAHFFNLMLGITIFLMERENGIPILSVVIFMCIIFVHIYTYPIEPLPVEGSDPDERKRIEEIRSRQRNKWMIFAYSFMLLSLLLTFYPFINPLFSSYKQSQAESNKQSRTVLDEKQYLKTLRERPIAVFVGCSLDTEAKNLSCIKQKSAAAAQDNKQGAPAAPIAPDAKSGAAAPPAAATDNKQGAPAGPIAPDAKPGAAAPPATPAIPAIPAPDNNQGAPAGPTAPGAKSAGAWVLNIGGYLENCVKNENEDYGKAFTCQVSDGLLVPLYFIILALMGGSISLTRRLPELQKQAGSEHVATEKQPKLTQYEFRENLIFQMVQFISAPFLAVLAYYLLEPTSMTNSVALAFTAGFASETILLMVRSVANKITPENNAILQYGAIAGVVTFGKKDPNSEGKPVDKVEVSLAGSPQIQSITDAQGFYMLGNVPVGDHSILFTSKENKAEIKEAVKIERAQAIVKKNVTIEKA